MNTYIEQQEKNLTTSVKNLSDSEDQSKLEINFTPETESTCFVELEFYSKISNEIIFSQNFSIVVRPVDFRLIPFPLFPFAVNTVAKFKSKSIFSLFSLKHLVCALCLTKKKISIKKIKLKQKPKYIFLFIHLLCD